MTIAVAFVALVLGFAAYATLRDGLRLHQWLAGLGWSSTATHGSWVANVLPDALWQFAFCTCVFEIWRESPRRWLAATGMAVPVVTGLGTEVGQAFHLIEGVFDPQDLIAMALASAAAYGWAHRPSRGHGTASRHSPARQRRSMLFVPCGVADVSPTCGTKSN